MFTFYPYKYAEPMVRSAKIRSFHLSSSSVAASEIDLSFWQLKSQMKNIFSASVQSRSWLIL